MKRIISAAVISFLLLVTMGVCSASGSDVGRTDSQTKDSKDETESLGPDYLRWQLDREQLSMKTDDLIENVLNYPYIVDLFCSNGIMDDSFSELKKVYNGLSELETRNNATEVLLKKYEYYLKEAEESGNSASVIKTMTLWRLLCEPVFYKKLSDNDKKCFDAITRTICDETQEGSRRDLYPDEFYLNGFHYLRSAVNDYTTSGILVPLYTAQSDFNVNWAELYAQNTANNYNITYLGRATSKYNCHSYAWYKNNTLNEATIVTVENYEMDPHSIEISGPVLGAIAVYYKYEDPKHSALITSFSGSTPICRSKWGADGLFEHPLAVVPSGYLQNGTVNCKYYIYQKSHQCSVSIDNYYTHTRTCTVCGWTCTEAHIANPRTGRCVPCGLQGPFEIPVRVQHVHDDYENCEDDLAENNPID